MKNKDSKLNRHFLDAGDRTKGSFAARTQRSSIAHATAFLALILIPSLASAAIYKCTAQDGSVTYTDVPCPADTTTRSIDPGALPTQYEPSQTSDYSFAVPDGKYESHPEILAILCANDEYKVWLKAQRHGLPEREVREARFVRLSVLCRRALHLPDMAPSIPQSSPKSVLGQEMPSRQILSRNQ